MTNGESRLVPPPSGRMRTGTSRSSRYLMAALLILVAVIGLRAGKPAVSWRGPLRTEGFSLALTVEAILAVLFIVLWRRGRSAPRPGHPAATIRVVLRRTIAVSMLAVVFLVLAGLVGLPFDKTHINPIYVQTPVKPPRTVPLYHDKLQFGGLIHLDLRVFWIVLVALMVLIPVIVVLSFLALRRRYRRLRRDRVTGVAAEFAASLVQAVESARLAMDSVDDAERAIIACYLAMETSLATAGAARAVAETPGELLARAERSSVLRGPAAGILTRLFYEARFSTHQLPQTARRDALQALDAISAELRGSAGEPAGAAPAAARGPR